MRIDVQKGKLILFWQEAPLMWLGFIIPALIVIPATLFMFIANRYGRLFCSSACMQGSMVELSNKIFMQLFGRTHFFVSAKEKQDSHFRTQRTRWKSQNTLKRAWLKTEALLILFGLPFLVAIASLAWFISPARILDEFLNLRFDPVHLGTIVTLTVLGMLNFLLVKDYFCRYMCYVGILQQYAGAGPLLKGAAPTADHDKRCIKCNACVDSCYMNVDPRKRITYTFDGCVSCGDCVVACEAEMGRHGEAPVLEMWVKKTPVK
jgi:polyferredoxin